MELTDMIKAICKRNKYSRLYEKYWLTHPFCEVCMGIQGHVQPSRPPHHIVTRGAGGSDNAWNLIALCAEHDKEVHTIGRETFMSKYGHCTAVKKFYKAIRKERKMRR